MLVLVSGGSGSGKSALAESIACGRFRELPENVRGRLLYAATMYADLTDPETVRRIARHRSLRAGKGFETVEVPTALETLEVRSGDVLLIEDLPNLLANEIWSPDGRVHSEEDAVRYLAEAVFSLTARGADVVAVTGEVSADGLTKEPGSEMLLYIRALNRVGIRLAEQADRVYESVAGISVEILMRQQDFL